VAEAASFGGFLSLLPTLAASATEMLQSDKRE
jgi:hypothetical protein